MPRIDQWPTDPKLQVVRGVDEGVGNWLKDNDFYRKYYLAPPSRDKQTEPKSTKHDQGLVNLVMNMIATQKTPYKNWGEFDRDSCLKNYRAQGVILEDEGIIGHAEELMNHQESDHRALMREKNKRFLENQAEDLSNANKVSEIEKVLTLCRRQVRYMQGRQLVELQGLIKRCEEALS